MFSMEVIMKKMFFMEVIMKKNIIRVLSLCLLATISMISSPLFAAAKATVVEPIAFETRGARYLVQAIEKHYKGSPAETAAKKLVLWVKESAEYPEIKHERNAWLNTILELTGRRGRADVCGEVSNTIKAETALEAVIMRVDNALAHTQELVHDAKDHFGTVSTFIQGMTNAALSEMSSITVADKFSFRSLTATADSDNTMKILLTNIIAGRAHGRIKNKCENLVNHMFVMAEGNIQINKKTLIGTDDAKVEDAEQKKLYSKSLIILLEAFEKIAKTDQKTAQSNAYYRDLLNVASDNKEWEVGHKEIVKTFGGWQATVIANSGILKSDPDYEFTRIVVLPIMRYYIKLLCAELGIVIESEKSGLLTISSDEQQAIQGYLVDLMTNGDEKSAISSSSLALMQKLIVGFDVAVKNNKVRRAARLIIVLKNMVETAIRAQDVLLIAHLYQEIVELLGSKGFLVDDDFKKIFDLAKDMRKALEESSNARSYTEFLRTFPLPSIVFFQHKHVTFPIIDNEQEGEGLLTISPSESIKGGHFLPSAVRSRLVTELAGTDDKVVCDIGGTIIDPSLSMCINLLRHNCSDDKTKSLLAKKYMRLKCVTFDDRKIAHKSFNECGLVVGKWVAQPGDIKKESTFFPQCYEKNFKKYIDAMYAYGVRHGVGILNEKGRTCKVDGYEIFANSDAKHPNKCIISCIHDHALKDRLGNDICSDIDCPLRRTGDAGKIKLSMIVQVGEGDKVSELSTGTKYPPMILTVFASQYMELPKVPVTATAVVVPAHVVAPSISVDYTKDPQEVLDIEGIAEPCKLHLVAAIVPVCMKLIADAVVQFGAGQKATYGKICSAITKSKKALEYVHRLKQEHKRPEACSAHSETALHSLACGCGIEWVKTSSKKTPVASSVIEFKVNPVILGVREVACPVCATFDPSRMVKVSIILPVT